jgi:hypothetical protein
VAERSNAAVSKTVSGSWVRRGFKSLPLRSLLQAERCDVDTRILRLVNDAAEPARDQLGNRTGLEHGEERLSFDPARERGRRPLAFRRCQQQ